METKNNQIQNFSNQQLIAKQQKTLDLCNGILNDNKQLSVLEMSLSIKNVFDSSNIKSIFKGDNAMVAYGVMNVLVKRFLESFGFSTKLNDPQIEIITIDALEHFSYESMEDAIVFFKMARQGKFGTTNRGVDSNLIFGTWLPIYLEQKSEMRERIYASEKNSISIENNAVEDFYKKHREKKLREAQEIKVKDKINDMVKTMNRVMLEDLIADWSKKPEMKPYLDYLKQKRLTIK